MCVCVCLCLCLCALTCTPMVAGITDVHAESDGDSVVSGYDSALDRQGHKSQADIGV